MDLNIFKSRIAYIFPKATKILMDAYRRRSTKSKIKKCLRFFLQTPIGGYIFFILTPTMCNTE